MKLKFANALSLALIVAMLFTSVALADNVVNDIVADPTITTATSTTVNYKIVGTGGDSEGGCNATAASPAVVTILKPAGVTATPPSLTFTSCNVPQAVVFTASVPGSFDISASVADSGPGSYSTTPANFELDVTVAPPSDTTAPSLNCTVPDQTVWYGSDVAVNCTASDSGSGLANPSDASFSLSTSVSSGTETDSAATGSRIVLDNAGNSITAGPYTFKVDKKAPGYSCGSADGIWHAGDVSIACIASDGGSGLLTPASFSLSTAVSAGSEDANASTGTAAVTDNVGNTTTAGPIAGNMIDKKAPAIACGTADGTWHAGDVSIACTASDDGSGLADPDNDASFNLSTSVAGGAEDNNASTGTRSVADAVGNSATAGPITGNMIDKKAPSVVCGSADGNWHATDQSVNCTATDGGSGPASQNVTLSTSVAAGTETDSAYTGSQSVSDAVGNSASAGPVGPFKIDKKAPTNVSFVGGGITNGSSYYFGSVPAGPTGCTADDGGSGLASCNVTGGGTGVGTHSYIATAIDGVGNQSIATLSYTVLAWTLKGFYQPVDQGILNNVKGGSTVPLKFEVFAGSSEFTNTNIISAFTQRISCAAGVGDDIETYATGNTTLRYDTTSGQFIFNWQTLKQPGACYRVTLTTSDGSSIFADFRLK